LSYPAAGEGARVATRERPDAAAGGRRAIVGSPATVRTGLASVAREYGTDELMLLTITYEHEARRRSYKLIADVMQQPLPGARSGAAPA
jgi:alkanesulfonate monooxygenase SsuD/methylene tetrahydromethanopterin reductase-like flavin-dependent oxidoreductase (luciferase family)